jgi:hypothetical protein
MTWTPVESTDVIAVGWEETDVEGVPLWPEFQGAPVPGSKGTMGVQFHRPPGSTYLYYDVPVELYQEFLAAPSKGQFMNFTLKRSGLAYEKVA